MLLFSSHLCASNLMVLESEFHNQTWYPLSKEVMHAAVVDSFISQVAQSHNFKLIPAMDSRVNQAGHILVNIHLVEQAETIKVSVRWSSLNGATHATSHSQSLNGKHYEGIYNTLEWVGRKAGIEISNQMTGGGTQNHKDVGQLEQVIKNQGDMAAILRELRHAQDGYTELLELKIRHHTSPDQRQTVNSEFDWVSKRQLDLAARLKREEKFEQAYATLRSLSSRPNLNEELKNAVREELYFTLPIYQADIEIAEIGRRAQRYQQEGTLWSRYESIQNNLQNALKNNEHDIKKSGEINRRLDQLAVSIKYLRQSLRVNTISKFNGMRIIIMQYYFESGRYPEVAFLQSELDYYGLKSSVEKTLDTGDEAIFTFTTNDGEIIKMRALHGQVEMDL